MTFRSRLRLASALVAFLGLATGTPASAQQGQVGQGLDNAGRSIKRGFQNAGQAVQGSFVKAKTNVHDMEIVSRIYSRLHWDKALATSTLELEVRPGGVAIVTGAVPDAAAKAKALNLTAETVGVAQVVDQLTISAPGGPAPIVPGNQPVVVPNNSTIIVPGNTPIVVPPTGRAKSEIPLRD